MIDRRLLRDWLVEALKANGGKAGIVQVCKTIWERHEGELRSSGDLFFTWQYDVRGAANRLRRSRVMKSI
jgi:hypothetical protein